MCVQRFDDSRNSAIHITYRISLRSSSMPEPRDPLLKVFTISHATQTARLQKLSVRRVSGGRGPGGGTRPPAALRRARRSNRVRYTRVGGWAPEDPHSVMILPQVHLRKPCYDFYFL